MRLAPWIVSAAGVAFWYYFAMAILSDHTLELASESLMRVLR